MSLRQRADSATNECQKRISIVCFIELSHFLNAKHVQMAASGLISVSHIHCKACVGVSNQ